MGNILQHKVPKSVTEGTCISYILLCNECKDKYEGIVVDKLEGIYKCKLCTHSAEVIYLKVDNSTIGYT
jgi:hypothetical protein